MSPYALPNPSRRAPRAALLWLALAALLGTSLAACGQAAGPGGAPTPAPTAADGSPGASGSLTATQAVSVTAAYTETDLVSSVRQLVFEGRRSGEGYFSPDGKQMIFQSERAADNPFYQQYILDLTSGESTLLSPGIGKTTCGWFHPTADKVLFASTHEDPAAQAKMTEELELRAKGEQRRYEWAFDDQFELYERPIAGGELKNLTRSPGYDAEGSWSPDGSQIVFTSNRLAYSQPPTGEDKALFEQDNGYLADIYLMDADGGNVRRLTDTKGYDGGPFFSPDGRQIVWRRFNAAGDKAEVWLMNADGTEQRQITHLDTLSWAPFFHPSGDYLIFSTNKHGFQNFELYLADAAGEKEPLRVTFTDGPDVLPIFAPDGRQLSWVTRRGIEGLGQIFLADWNDARARELLALAPAQGSAVYQDSAPAGPTQDLAALTSADILPADAQVHVTALTGEAMDGRLTGTPGEAAATRYVADAFGALGLSPAGTQGYFQPFAFTSGVELGQPNMLVVQLGDGSELEPVVDEEWRPLAFSKPGSADFAELVFAGYGLDVPAEDGQPAYDSYGDLDVAGKWVVVLRYVPEDVSPERRQVLNRYSSLRFKAAEARDRGAAGLLVVSGPGSQAKDDLVALKYDGTVGGASLPAASIGDALAGRLFTQAGQDLAASQQALDGGEILPGFALPGAKVGAHFTLDFDEGTGRNVIGRLQVADKPSDEVVVLGAHVDHLGHGEAGDSLARPEEQGQVHPGADDNASGVAGLIEIAQHLADKAARGELTGERDFVFAAWSGEELGLLGSNHYVKALKEASGEADLYPQVAAYLNMDMIGRLKDKLVLQGVASSPFWKAAIEKRNVPVGLPLALSDDTYLPTDATSFYLAGVPILAAFTGAHGEYHSPRDKADLVDYADLAKTARLIGLLAEDVSAAEAPPAYVAVAAPARGASGGRSGRAYLGTIPDYAESAVEGVLLSGISTDSPAAKAGLKSGDVLVGLAGQELGNIYDFTKVLDGLKIGQEVEVVVLRDGQRLTLKVTPAARE